METQMSLSQSGVSGMLTKAALSGKVVEVRGVKVMLDRDVAEALGTEVRAVNQNAERSPKWEYLRQSGIEGQYRFKLTEDDVARLQSQIVIGNENQHLPWAYTRKGCAYFGTSMNSPQACSQAVELVEVFDKVQEVRALSPAQALHEMTRIMVEQENRVRDIERTQAQQGAQIEDLRAKSIVTNTDHYSISGFASLKGIKLTVDRCIPLGKKASKRSRIDGYPVGKAHSLIYGQVNTYHVDVLNRVFEDEGLLATQ